MHAQPYVRTAVMIFIAVTTGRVNMQVVMASLQNCKQASAQSALPTSHLAYIQ